MFWVLAGDVCNVVLDESDRMLGLGFAPQIDALKQMLLPSTTAAQGGKNARRVQVSCQVVQSVALNYVQCINQIATGYAYTAGWSVHGHHARITGCCRVSLAAPS